MKQYLNGALSALLASCIFGSSMWWVVLATRAGWGNYALGFVSAGLGGLASQAAYRFSRQARENRYPKKHLNFAQLWPSLRIGLVLFGANVSMFLALRWVEPPVVAFFAGLQVLWVTVIELFLRQLRLNIWLGSSILLCLTGILFINEIPVFTNSGFHLQLDSYNMANTFAILTGMLFGLSIYWIRRIRKSDGQGQASNPPSEPAQMTALLNSVISTGNFLIVLGFMANALLQGAETYLLTAGFVPFPSFSPFAGVGPAGPQAWLPWLYPVLLGLGSFFGATLLQIHAQKYLGGTQVGILMALQPISTIALGTLLFGFSLSLNQTIGGTMLLAASIISIAASSHAPEISK
ncbi:DMT family transporter [Candidatus Haliotispira prima]|uniref:DMT family transporter n=1 Tax=Candidatus Haliotispira prima TaxID=3034016 RepID=A0ABY8MIQ5_9SPIO|nr:DMT family transporter [Candidatus Haliotispira prima]